MKNKKTLLLFLIVIGALSFFLFEKMNSKKTAPANDQTPGKAVEKQSPSAKIKYPLAPDSNATDSPDKDDPIPKLDESDKDLQQKFSDFFGKLDFQDVVNAEDFIRHFVIAIENATGKQIPTAMSHIQTTPGELLTTGSGDELKLSEKNYKRYHKFVALAQAADLKKMVAYYRRIYPLFQSAYQDLGTQRYFNDKLVDVIDNVLATPKVNGPIKLICSSVHCEFADPQLESLSAVQKILLRMGPENSKILKSKFRTLRQMLTN